MSAPLPLAGVRVVDAATVYAGPVVGTLLGDYGADVIKVEHPRGDALRHWEWRKDGESLWWALIGRNKRAITLALSDPRGAELLRRLLAGTDIFIENFRPGTLEKWGLDPADLLRINPRLIVLRVSGFGQTGPHRRRPGFGTMAESISGFAHTNGEPDGPPILPQWPLADGIAGLVGCFTSIMALRHAERTGQGQVVDLSIYEPLFWILGAQTSAYDQLGVIPGRLGSRTEFNVPRNGYRTRDGRWVALSGATVTAGRRVMRAVGRGDLADMPWFQDIDGRLEHADEIDDAIARWVAERDSAEVLRAFAEADVTAAPVYSIADIMADEHFLARGSITSVEHPSLGPLRMQGLIARLTETPGRVRHPGPRLGEHNDQILREELGCSPDLLQELARDGVIAAPADPEQSPPKGTSCRPTRSEAGQPSSGSSDHH